MKFLRILFIFSIFITRSLCVLRKTAIQMDTIDDKVFSCPCGCTIVTSKNNELILTAFELGCQTNPTANIMSYRVHCPCGCQGTLKTGDQFYLPPTDSCTLASYSVIHNDKRQCPCSCLNQDLGSEIKYLIHRSPFCTEGLKTIMTTIAPPSMTNISLSANSSSESTNETLPSSNDSIISDKTSNIGSLSNDSANISSNFSDTTSLFSSSADLKGISITPTKPANTLSDPLPSSNLLKTVPNLNTPSDSSLTSTLFKTTPNKSTPTDVPTNSSKLSLNPAKPALVLNMPSMSFPTAPMAFSVPNTLLQPTIISSTSSKTVPSPITSSDSFFKPSNPINTPLLSINSSTSGTVSFPNNAPSVSSLKPSKPDIILNNHVDPNITSNSSETLSAPNRFLNSFITS